MAQFADILKEIEKSIQNFNRKIPSTQKDVLAGIEEELRNLDLDGGKIKATVKNLSLIARIKNKLAKIILTDDYKADVKNFAESFNEITRLQNTYWKQVEKEFKPRPLLREIKNITIGDTVNKLMESGINANLVDPVSDILRTNITAGGSYRDLTDQLKQALTDTNTPGLLSRYAKGTTIDSLNSYSAQYAQVVSSDLGFEWYKYSNTDIETTRPFCDAMTDRPFFHVSEIPQLLRAEGLTYVNKKGQRVSVPIYSKTGLPHGMKDGTSAENFLTNRGGWNCGHQCRPVSEGLVPQSDKDRVFSSPGYLRWKSSIVPQAEEAPQAPSVPKPAGNPIGKQFSNIQKPVVKHTKDALDAIDDVHGDGDLPNIPFEKDSKGKNRHAAFWSMPGRDGNTPIKITLSNKATEPAFSLVHEMGHFLDLAAIGPKGRFASTLPDSPMGGVIKAINESNSMKEINQIIKSKTALRNGKPVHLIKSSVEYFKYLANDKEKWARAYAQYVANKTTNKAVKEGLAQSLERKEGEVYDHKQWDADDFVKIESAIDKMMTELKWTSR